MGTEVFWPKPHGCWGFSHLFQMRLASKKTHPPGAFREFLGTRGFSCVPDRNQNIFLQLYLHYTNILFSCCQVKLINVIVQLSPNEIWTEHISWNYRIIGWIIKIVNVVINALDLLFLVFAPNNCCEIKFLGKWFKMNIAGV